jgi:hypothetical protein
MWRATITILILLAARGPASAVEDRGDFEPERAQQAPVNLFPLPGPVYDEAGRLLAAPPPSDLRDAHDVLLRLPVLPEAAPRAGAEPPRTRPPRRSER